MKYIKFSQLLDFQKKSHIKAGAGLKEGKFPFFTSSQAISKYIDTSQFNLPSLIFGTGGNANIHMSETPFSASTDCLVAQLKSNITKKFEIKFVYYYLFGNIWILEKGFKGAGLKHISKGYINNINIPDISIEDQKQIIKILDQADSLRQRRRQSTLLLDKYLKSVFLEMFGDPLINSKKWDYLPLNRVCDEIYRYPTFYGFKYVKDGAPVIKIGNILKNGMVDSDLSNYDFIPENVNIRYPRTRIELYDIIMAVRGDGSTVKRVGLVTDPKLIGANISPNLLRFKTNNNKLLPLYLYSLITSPQGQSMFEKYITQTAKKTITARDIKQITIPIPPLTIQQKFSNIFKEQKVLKQKMLEQSVELENEFQSLMQKAFKGELSTS